MLREDFGIPIKTFRNWRENVNPIFIQKALAERSISSRLNSLQFLFTILVENCGAA
jgi:hypothetical protein